MFLNIYSMLVENAMYVGLQILGVSVLFEAHAGLGTGPSHNL